jgi:hypothetical protein
MAAWMAWNMERKQQVLYDASQLECTSCGGVSFFEAPIADSKTGLTYQLHRCRECGHIRWPEPRE